MGRLIDEDEVIKCVSDRIGNEYIIDNIKKLPNQEAVKSDNEFAAFKEWVKKEFDKSMSEHGWWEYSEILEGVLYTIDEYCRNKAKREKNDKNNL